MTTDCRDVTSPNVYVERVRRGRRFAPLHPHTKHSAAERCGLRSVWPPYSTVALVEPISTMDAWRAIT